MNSLDLVDEILKYHRKKGKKDIPRKLGMFDYHQLIGDWVGCDKKCTKLLKELEYQKLKETMKEP